MDDDGSAGGGGKSCQICDVTSRITRHRIQTLAAVMGVSSAVHIELSRKRTEEAEERFR